MSYKIWNPPARKSYSPSNPKKTIEIKVWTNAHGRTCSRVSLPVAVMDQFNLDRFKALDIYVDREKGLIGLEVIATGKFKFNINPKIRSYCLGELVLLLTEFGLKIDRSISIPLHDVSERVPPVQLEIRVAEVAEALKQAKVASK